MGGADVRLGWNLLSWRFLVGFIIVQLVLLAIMYRYVPCSSLQPQKSADTEIASVRYAHVQARKIFLTTYYDPFDPDLYIHLLKPDTTHHSIPTCPSWSIFSVFSSLQRAGLKGVVGDAWESTSCAISSYLQSTWAGRHHPQDTIPRTWPPT